MEELTTDEKITIEIEHAEVTIAMQKERINDYREKIKHLVNDDIVSNIDSVKLYMRNLERTIRQLRTNEDTLDLLVYISANQDKEGD